MVAQRVCDVLADANACVNTDFSRFDGHVSPALRQLEEAIMLRAFRPKYTNELLDLQRSQYKMRGFGRFGSKYETGTARCSGSPETSAFNSIANAFVAYLALRMDRRDGSYAEPTEAWRRLGIYGGDDGLTADISPAAYVKAASSLGQKLDIQPVLRGNYGVKFLARCYGPDVWFGDPNSICDLGRQLSKFHTTVSMPSTITPEDKLFEKTRAYLLTDRNTPIIGDLLGRIERLDPVGVCSKHKSSNYMTVWNADLDASAQYPNDESVRGWAGLAVEELTAQYGFRVGDFLVWLSKVATVQDIITSMPKLCDDPTPTTKVPVVVDGRVVSPTQGKTDRNIPKKRPNNDQVAVVRNEQERRKTRRAKQHARARTASGSDLVA